jgi:restriction system protein
MAIPDFQSIMLPLLQFASDERDHTVVETENHLARHFNLTEDERSELLPSGKTRLFNNRISWAKTYLQQSKLIDLPKRGVYRISERGKQVLKNAPTRIDINFLKQFKEYVEFAHPSKQRQNDVDSLELSQGVSPREVLENSYNTIRRKLADDLLEKVKQSTPQFFEQLVVELLVNMGYGGSLKDAGAATKYTNDEGIDGIIKEDKLGLGKIYLQAKRYTDKSVGRPEIQAFVGALEGKHAQKGVFITTSTFAPSAVEYARAISKTIVLVDGQQLAEFMIDFDIGVSHDVTFVLKNVDNDYFEQ